MFDINIHIDKNSNSAWHFSEKFKAVSVFFGMRMGEGPKFHLVRSNGEKEIRKYSALTLASISLPFSLLSLELVQLNSYKALSGYLSGKNDLAEKIGITSAILHEETQLQEGDGFITMSFILPNKFDLKNAPRPIDQRIKLHQQPPKMVACLAFSGPADEQKIQKYSTELREWLSQYSSYKVDQQVKIAEYNSPKTLSFLRKNEIQIDLKTV